MASPWTFNLHQDEGKRQTDQNLVLLGQWDQLGVVVSVVANHLALVPLAVRLALRMMILLYF